MPHYLEFFQNNYLKSFQLQGKDATLTIMNVELEHLVMDGGKENDKLVIQFAETPKKLIIGKTHAKQISKSTGETDIDKWVNKKITIYPTTCKGQGKEIVECIRTRVNREGMK